MFFTSELSALVLYSLQQLGVMLAVGAQTILLAAYLVSLYDGTVEPKEDQFARVVRRALYTGLAVIILSGAGVVAYHTLLGQLAIVFTPAFLFKWLLIALLLLAAFARPHKPAFSHPLWEGAVGGTWYALFVVHILAPAASWVVFLGLYGAWLLGFEACWWALTVALQGGRADTHQLKLPTAHKTVIHKPAVPKPVVQAHKPSPKPVPKPATIPPFVPMPKPKPVVVVKSAPLPQSLPAMHVQTPPAPKPPPAPPPPVVKHDLPPPVPHKPAVPAPTKPQWMSVAVPHKPHDATVPPDRTLVPALRVMPRTPEDVEKQSLINVVPFTQA